MKITLNKALRQALLAVCIACPSVALAQNVVDTYTTADTYLKDATTETVIINFVAAGDDYFNNSDFTTEDNIQVQQWHIGNGWGSTGGTNQQRVFTFNGSISDYTGEGAGDGNIVGWNWSNKFYNVTFAFNGDMSGFTGDISADVSGLALSFGGTARASVSGQGAIDTVTAVTDTSRYLPVTYDVGVGESSITNTSIKTTTLNFNGGAGVIYNVGEGSVSTAITTHTLNVEAGTVVNMGAGTSLSVTNTAVNTTGAFSFADSSTLSVLSGSIMGNVSLDGNVSMDLVLGGSPALTMGELSFTDTTLLTISTALAGAQAAGSSYVLLDAANDLSDADLAKFILDLGVGAPSVNLQIVDGNLNLVVARTSQNLDWTAGNGTWTNGSSSNWTGGTEGFGNTDTVNFNNAHSGATQSIEIVGDVYPAYVVVDGAGDTEFWGTGSIGGVASLIKNGEGSLIISTSNNYTGTTTVSRGKLIIDNDNALGSSTAEVSSDATIAFKGLSHLAHTSYTLAAGATLELMAHEDDHTYAAGLASIAANTILKVADNQGTITLGTAGTITNRVGGSYTISVGVGSTLVDYARVRLDSTMGDTVITGGGTYIIDSFVGHNATAATSTLVVDTDTTLKVTNAQNHKDAPTAGFMLANFPGSGEVTVKGTLDLASGISVRDGSGTLTVENRGELIMRQGLTSTSGTITVNIESGASLNLYNQADTSDHSLTVNLLDGATMRAMGVSEGTAGVSNVYSNLTIAADANITLAAAENNTLAYHHGITAQSVSVEDQGKIQVKSVNLNDGTSSLSIVGTGTNDMVSISNKDATAVSLNAMTATSIAGIDISDATITGSGTALTLSNSTLTNVSITNADLTLNDVKLNNVDLGSTLVSTTVGSALTPGFETAEGTIEDVLMVTLTGFENVSIDGAISIDLGDLGDVFEAAYANGDMIVFTLDGVTDAEFNTWYHDIELSFLDGAGNLVTENALGFVVSASGDIQLYIPEPSTATLSLLALAGLLARRRRKTA